MAEFSAISWTDATFNPWIGCTKVSAACDGCYAEADNKRRKWVEGWGAGVPRRRTTKAYWRQPLAWDRLSVQNGRKMKVFGGSLCDFLDNEVDPIWRDDYWDLIKATPNLWWLLLTKRIGNARKMLPPDWGEGYPNVVLMATLESQEVWDRDIDKLMSVPAVLHGVSVEPMLSHVDICGWQPDWIITGGESGPNRRPLDMDNVRSMRDQCASAGIAFHHKQNGGLRGKDNGCLVDGVEHKHFPVALR